MRALPHRSQADAHARIASEPDAVIGDRRVESRPRAATDVATTRASMTDDVGHRLASRSGRRRPRRPAEAPEGLRSRRRSRSRHPRRGVQLVRGARRQGPVRRAPAGARRRRECGCRRLHPSCLRRARAAVDPCVPGHRRTLSRIRPILKTSAARVGPRPSCRSRRKRSRSSSRAAISRSRDR